MQAMSSRSRSNMEVASWRERGSLAAALVDCSRDAAQDVHLFRAQLRAVGQALQAGHQLLRRGRVEETKRLERGLPMADQPPHGDGVGEAAVERPFRRAESAQRLTPV